jgi:hypothetical protein
MKKEAACFSKILAPVYFNARRRIENTKLNIHCRCENVISDKSYSVGKSGMRRPTLVYNTKRGYSWHD